MNNGYVFYSKTMDRKAARQLVQKMAAEKGIVITKKQCQSWQGDPNSGLYWGNFDFLLNALRDGVKLSHIYSARAREYTLNCDPRFKKSVANKEMISVLSKLAS